MSTDEREVGRNVTVSYDHDTVCDGCGHPKGQIPTEHANNRPGWKCLNCRWWNWIRPNKEGAVT